MIKALTGGQHGFPLIQHIVFFTTVLSHVQCCHPSQELCHWGLLWVDPPVPRARCPSIYQSQNAKRASSQKRHMVISIFLLCNSLILMSIGAGSIRAIKGGLDKVFKIWDRHHQIHRQILRYNEGLILILAQR